MTDEPVRQCTLCGLLCAQTSTASSWALNDCSIYRHWTRTTKSSSLRPDLNRLAQAAPEQIRRLLAGAQHPLIWLDTADVLTTRAAVELAGKYAATVHIPQSIGQMSLRRVMANDGWFGTTLAEMAEQSHLVITLGSRWAERIPLLAHRWLSSATGSGRQWWTVHPAGEPFPSSSIPADCTEHLRRLDWPRREWYSRFTQVNQRVAEISGCSSGGYRAPASVIESVRANVNDSLESETAARSRPIAEIAQLADAIAASPSTTLLWEVSELDEAEDQQLIYRLFQLSQSRSEKAICNLLAIDSEVGRETARATLLWLTGCTGTAQPTGSGWRRPEFVEHFSWSQWQQAFDFILLIRALPSPDPLPQLQSTITLCESPEVANPDLHHGLIPIAASGMQSEAFLLRGDHGSTLFSKGLAGGLKTGEPSARPSANQLLRQACWLPPNLVEPK
jgi:hypothetical protein